jgi:predicted PurR-regulated permease PerM
VAEEVVFKDLTVTAPRRWSDELGGIQWLPRLIDKARAALHGRLGDYYYGQCPLDRGLLLALGISYAEFTNIVREAGENDERVLELLQARNADGVELARRWSQRLPKRRFFLFLLDLDDGHNGGPLHAFRGVIRFFASLISRYVRYRWPMRGALIGLEAKAERDGARAEAARGAEEEPYRWLTAQNLDFSWKILLSIFLIVLIFGYIIRFIENIGEIFLIIVGAIFFAYLIYPVIRWLNGRLPLLVSILIVYAVLAAIVAVGLTYLIPTISAETASLVKSWPTMQTKLAAYVQDPNNPLFKHAPANIRNEIARLPQTLVTWVQTHGASAFGNAVSVVIGTVAFIGACIIVPVLGAYLLNDSETIKRFFMGFIPQRRRDATLNLLAELEEVIGGFIRGQLLVGVSVGILIAIGLMLVGEPYAILIGAIAGLLDFIPYIGPVIAALPAVTIGFISGGVPLAIKVIVVFVLANQAEGHIIAPNIVSRTIKLSPSAVVVAILIGGKLYGVPGMFIAVPVAAIIRVLLLHVIPGSVSRDEAKPVLTKDPRETAEEAAAP